MASQSASINSPLIIKSRDWGLLPLVVLFLAVALLAWLYRPLLMCDHSVGTCTLNANDMPGNPQKTFAIAGVQRAGIQTRDSSDAGPQSRAVLETTGAPVLIGAAWSSDPGIAEAMAQRINAFLASDESGTLKLTPAKGLHYGSLTFLSIAIVLGLVFLFISRRYRSVLDTNRDHYRIESRSLLGNKSAEGALSAITGTFEKAAGGTQRSRNQLGLLDAQCQFHPLSVPCTPGGRKMRKLKTRIHRLLALDESRGLKHWDLKPKLDELAASIGRTSAQTEELAELQAELEVDPHNIDLLRQTALRLKRLGRSDEASTLLRARHRDLIDRDQPAKANHLAGIVWTMGL